MSALEIFSGYQWLLEVDADLDDALVRSFAEISQYVFAAVHLVATDPVQGRRSP